MRVYGEQKLEIMTEKGGPSMAEHEPVSPVQKKQEAAKLWLSYYNRVLFEKGIITEQERNRMALKIDRRQTPPAVRSYGCALRQDP